MARHTSVSSSSDASGTASDSEQDGLSFLEQLSRKQVLEISSAFDKAGKAQQGGDGRSAKRRKTAKGKGKEVEAAAGGFLLDDDDDEAAGGGFIPEEPAASSSKKAAASPKSVLLDEVPSILGSLGLDGDDPSILSIFENASEEDRDRMPIVKRKKFMRVAAILIIQRDEEDQALRPSNSSTSKKVHSGGGKRRAVRLDVDEQQNEHDDSDPLVLSSDEEDEDDPENDDSDPWADEDDLDGAFTGNPRQSASPPSTRRATRSVASAKALESLPTSTSPEPSTSKSTSKGKGKAKATTRTTSEKELKLSSKQKEECERMFHQFFNSSDKGKNKGITMSEIRYVATLLNEKISDADVGILIRYSSVLSDALSSSR